MYSLHKRTNQKALQPEPFKLKETESRPIIELPDPEILKELAMLANAIYFPTNTNILPASWNYWTKSSYPNGTPDFMGAFLYQYVDGKVTSWAIVIRGTVIANPKNIVDDILIMLEKVPLQMKSASDYIAAEILRIKNWVSNKELAKSWDEVPIYVVGHSLGAVVANMAFTDLEVPNDGRIQCVGFDNPGSLNIVQHYLKQNGKSDGLMGALAPLVHNIQADVNIINTCNPQWGAVYRVLRWGFNYGESARALIPIRESYMFNYHYLTVYSINDQHQKILESIQRGYPIHFDDENPWGFREGYKQYIDGVKRKKYWTQYFKYCWDIDVDIRDTYKDFDKFSDRMFSELMKVYDESSFLLEKSINENHDEELMEQASNA